MTLKSRRAKAAILFLLGAACYLNTLGNGFVWDDHETIEENTFIQKPKNALTILNPRFLWEPRWEIQNQARPVWVLSAMADWAVYGNRAWGHHLTNILFHSANGVLLFLFLLLAGFPEEAALWACALFAVHPIHVEPVSAVSFREDLLVLFFSLVSWILLLKGRDKNFRDELPWHLGSLAAFFLALMSKEMAVTLPFLMFLLDFSILRKGRESLAPRRLARWLPFLALLAYYLWFHSVRFNYHHVGMLSPSAPLPAAGQAQSAAPPNLIAAAAKAVHHAREILPGVTLEGAAATFGIFIRYLAQLIFPLHLCADYRIPALTDLDVALAVLWMALFALCAWGLRRSSWTAFGMMWFMLSLAPVSNYIPILNLRADRYLYLPSAGFCLSAGWLFHLASRRRRRPALAALGLVLALCAFRTAARNRDWRSDMAIFSDTVSCSPDNFRVHYNFGVLLQKENRCEEAVSHYATAEALHPNRSVTYLNRGVCLESLGKREDATREYEKGLALFPAEASLLSNLAGIHIRAGRFREARELYQRAVWAKPDDINARLNLGVCLAQTGKLAEAAGEFSAVLAADPGNAMARENLKLLKKVPPISPVTPDLKPNSKP